MTVNIAERQTRRLPRNTNFSFNLLCCVCPHSANSPLLSPHHLCASPVGTHLHPPPADSEGASKTQSDSPAKVRFLTLHVSGLWVQKPLNSHLSRRPGTKSPGRVGGASKQGPSADQPLLERTVRGGQTSGPAALFDGCEPCHVTHTHPHAHTPTLPSTFSRMAAHNKLPPLPPSAPPELKKKGQHQTRSPIAHYTFEK